MRSSLSRNVGLPGIYAGPIRPSQRPGRNIGIWLLLGLDLLFVYSFLRTQLINLPPTLTILVRDIGFGCIMVASGIVISKSSACLFRRFFLWVVPYLYVLSNIVVLSLFDPSTKSLTAFEFCHTVLPFIVPVTAVITAFEFDWASLNKTLTVHLLLGAIAVITIAIKYPCQRGDAGFLDSPFMLSRQLIYAYAYIAILSPRLGLLGKVAAATGVIAALVVALNLQGRGQFFVGFGAVIVLCIWVWLMAADKHLFNWHRIWRVSVGAFLLVVLACGTMSFVNSKLDFGAKVEGLVDRLNGNKGAVTTALEDPRWIELHDIRQQFSLSDWIIGRGINGSYKSGTFGDVDSNGYRHFADCGYLFLILKGGIFLALLYLLFPILPAWRTMFTSRSIELGACAGVVVMFSLNLIYAGQPDVSPGHVLMFLCAGRLIALRNPGLSPGLAAAKPSHIAGTVSKL